MAMTAAKSAVVQDSDFDDAVVKTYDEVLRQGPLHDSVQAGLQNRAVDAQNIPTIENLLCKKWTLLRARRVLLAQLRQSEVVDAKINVEQCLLLLEGTVVVQHLATLRKR